VTLEEKTATDMVTVFTAEKIAQRVHELGSAISKDYRGSTDLILIGILKGAAVFLSDLLRALDIPAEVEFIRVSSYGVERASSGVVDVLADIGCSLDGKDVIVVDGILDSGLTLDFILNHLTTKGKPRSVQVCTLLSKGAKARPGALPKYVGFEIDDQFVVGYGLDLAEKYRNLPYIAALK
jgi:hypoxanthine phosphoribosyltransferase